MKLSLNHWRHLAAVCAVVAGLAVVASAQIPFGNLAVYPPDENVLGMSYGDWSAAWWQYVLTYTNDVNPATDSTGQYCNEGQGGPVFFLAGAASGTAARTCTIPAGKALFVPIINVECSTVEPPVFRGNNAQEARACAASWADGIGASSLKVTIDGRKVLGLGLFRAVSPFYDFIVPPSNNYLGVDGVTSGSSVSDGYWVMVKPLSPGVHVIHFEGAWVSGPALGWAPQNVTYTLTVLP